MKEVAITGIGVHSPIGLDVPSVLESLLELRSGIRRIDIAATGKAYAVGLIENDFSERFSKMERPLLDRIAQLAVLAAEQASKDAGIADYSTFGERAGVFFGTARGGVTTEWAASQEFTQTPAKTARPYYLMGSMPNSATSQISIRQQIHGPSVTHTSACSSSGVAIADACRHILCGELDIALAGGSESTVQPEVAPIFLRLWDALRALADVADDPSTSCRPFSSDRTGLALAEGSAFFVLESVEHARRRGANILGYVCGSAVASDAHHMGAPHPRGQVAAMRGALRAAGIDISQVDYVNAHATATREGDGVEIAAMREVLGTESERIPVSSTKALHGHMLGAASAMEALVCLLAARHAFIPATAHLGEVAEECRGVQHVREVRRDTPVRHAMTLSAGFGGTNCALILRAHDPHPVHAHPGSPRP